MKRTRATHLALVNWRGVFYERYELSNTVTALEGANGAGKTTVLVAAFIALLPDMNYLRFSNVGETTSSGEDRGIWGRLGKAGRPSYTVLDLTLANGERLLAGVHLERRSEPTVEPTPFLITEFPHGEKLQELLLVRGNAQDAVPEMEELRDQAARFGARLQQCAAAKEYFTALFDRGVTPLRLDGDSERAKLSEMLRTSMTGGMSRVLTKGLRAFLLKEERGLGDTLKRMRSNIDACRRTRAEVEEARTLEGEISRVYEAGQEMFNAAVHATEQTAEEAAKRVSEAEEKARHAQTSVKASEEALEAARVEQGQARHDLKVVQDALKRDEEEVRRLETGRGLQQRIERARSGIEAMRETRGWPSNLESNDDLSALRQALEKRRDRSRDKARDLKTTHQGLEQERKRLAEGGGSLSPQLRKLARTLGAETVAGNYEEIALEEAGEEEARLGPLVNAIVVEDPESAARMVASAEERPESVWLARHGAISAPGVAGGPRSERIGDSMIVQSSEEVWRATDIPERPVLGRRARERKIAALEQEAESVGSEIRRVEAGQREIEAELTELDGVRKKLGEINQAQAQLAEMGIEDAGEAAIADARARLVERRREQESADGRSRELDTQLGKLGAELGQARRYLEAAQEDLKDQRALAGPAQQRWERLQADAEEGALLTATRIPEVVEQHKGRGSGNLYSDALTWARNLHDRLIQAEPDGDVGKKLDELCRLDERSGDDYLRAWRTVRMWLHRRIPAQIAEMDDPVEALARLRTNLAELEKRLGSQESELQGNTADVASAIGAQTRRARREVQQLNRDLERVRFGSIAGVRLELRRVPEMENVLEALRNGDGQRGLFAPDMPLEEALNELFRKFAGLRAQGQRLLDYREYVDPRVEVRRNAGTGWETANPNRVSTGESIGIGTALMMVVLTAWERGGSLMRAQSAHGTLRLLFLDEGSRLDRENLSVLFDLCRSLDLQLLVAAPEVAQAEGNTTYRLVRVSGGNGDEEVRVTGRRVVAQGTA